MTSEERAAFLAHVGQCSRCDRAFRVFALTAPVLHGDSGPGTPHPAAQPSVVTDEVSLSGWHDTAVTSRRGATVTGSAVSPFALRRVWAAAAMAAAAVFAVYVATAAPGQTFEDVIAGEDSAADLSTVAPDNGVLGDAALDQDTSTQDPFTQSNVGTNDLAR